MCVDGGLALVVGHRVVGRQYACGIPLQSGPDDPVQDPGFDHVVLGMLLVRSDVGSGVEGCEQLGAGCLLCGS